MAFSKYPNENVTKGKCQKGTSGMRLREKHASQEEEEGWGWGEAQGHTGEFVGPIKGFGAPVLKRGGGLWPPWTLNAEVSLRSVRLHVFLTSCSSCPTAVCRASALGRRGVWDSYGWSPPCDGPPEMQSA